jgi:N-acetylgalactosamine kinase
VKDFADASAWSPEEIDRARSLAAALRVSNPLRAIAARVPGRVNLIGEHTDYSNLPVLPAAIDRTTIVVAAVRSDRMVVARNANSKFAPRSFELSNEITPFEAGDWGNYVKAAVQGIANHLQACGGSQLRGIDLIVDGRVPAAAGLSSSAALTVAVTLAMTAVNEVEIARLELAQLAALSERYIGTLAGGMDQAASVLGRLDHALFIEFDPLRASPVPIPADAALVVADSLEQADKSGQVRAEYNRRVIECAVAARLVGKTLGLSNIRVLGDVVRQSPRRTIDELITALGDGNAVIGGLIEAAGLLEMSESGLRVELFGSGAKRRFIDDPGELKIFQRARHVLSETARVNEAVAALRRGDLSAMGELMDNSHRSLAIDFEVSTERLDKMVVCARAAGAVGARLTGAGFGGSILALCRRSDVPAVIAALDEEYYARIGVRDARANRTVFRASPGASALELSELSA